MIHLRSVRLGPIDSFDSEQIRQVAYGEVEHVSFTKAFLNSPQQFLRHL